MTTEDNWAWSDPDELRIRLDMALEHAAVLEAEIQRLRTLLTRAGLDPDASGIARPMSPGYAGKPDDDPSAAVAADSPIEAKLILFRRLFRGRDDVYARRWVGRDGRVGWSPAEADPYNRSLPDSKRTFFPLTDQVLFKHLSRQDSEPERDDLHVGLYPMLPDDRCYLLVADFDGKDGSDWRGDAAAFLAVCRDLDVPAHLEVSRSGRGAHVWIFFDSPVAAATARTMGLGLVRRALSGRPGMTLTSYDRLFPSQDFLPVNAKGGHRFGNLVALPLHGKSRADGTCVFVDPVTWHPHVDQFAYLASAATMSAMSLEEIAESLGRLDAGPANTEPAMPARPRRQALGTAPAIVQARTAASLGIAVAGLPAPLVAAIKHTASFFNPEFFRKQAQRFSTWNTPRLVRCFNDTDAEWIEVPRGLRDEIAGLVASAGGRLEITDGLPGPSPIDVRFTGALTEPQAQAVAALQGHDLGVLQAPTGFGKTVVACALLAHHSCRTAIIVNRAELVAQWTDRLHEFLELGDVTVGTLGAGRDRRGHGVDVIMLQSLSRRDSPEGLLDGYDLVIVDECHGVAAPAAEAVLRAARVRRWIGLSATPFRADSMDPLITMLLGPIRHVAEATDTLTKNLVVHLTGFETREALRDGASIQAMYGELAADQARNQLIVSDLGGAYARGRRILALANRVEHLTVIANALTAKGIPSLQLHGGLPAADRARVRAAMSPNHPGPLVVLAIDKIAGEGLDADLDTLFLLNPVSFKGRVIQQVGRIMRTRDGKSDVEVHDYADTAVPMLERMHHRRRRVLIKQGFVITDVPMAVRAPVARRQPVQTDRDVAVTPGEPSAAEIRVWARDNGIAVPQRGRIPGDVKAAYRHAHPASAGPG